MKLAGRCPLDNNLSEDFLNVKLEKFYGKPVSMSAEKMRKEFCKKICKNILC